MKVDKKINKATNIFMKSTVFPVSFKNKQNKSFFRVLQQSREIMSFRKKKKNTEKK